MIKNQIEKQLASTYGEFTLLRLTGGYTNETFLLKGTNPPLVAKISNHINQDIDNEINSLKVMQGTKVVPKLYDAFQLDNQQVTIIEYCEGENAQRILDRNEFEKIKETYKLLGRVLAKEIHIKKYSLDLKGIRRCNLNELSLDLDFVPEDLKHFSAGMLNRLNDQTEDWVLTHGDYGVHNVLFSSNNSITVLDWEWSEWANPITDIAWVCWFTGLHYPKLANELNPIFVQEYQKHNPIKLSQHLLKSYCIYKVWKVLHKVNHASVDAKKEWVRRLKWTIETNIFTLTQ